MRPPFLILASAAVVTLTAPRVLAAQVSIVSRPSVLDSLSAHLVELELERVSSTAGFGQNPRSARDLSAQIEMLHERLRALPEGAAADREANKRVLSALDARESRVGAQLDAARQFYTDEHPVVRDLSSERRALDQRRAEIRRTP